MAVARSLYGRGGAVFVSSSRGARPSVRPAGLEPARHRWQRCRLPLHHGRVSETTGTRTLTIRSRAEDAAANTLVPCSGVGETRTHTPSLKRRVRCRYATTPILLGAGVWTGIESWSS